MKNIVWGLLLFVLNIFILLLNYIKGFSFDVTFFVEANQMLAFLVGIMYSQQTRKFGLKPISGLIYNSLTFSILITLLFGVYEAPVSFNFTFLLFISMFICMFISFALYYWLFCPDRYKRKATNRKQVKKSIERLRNRKI